MRSYVKPVGFERTDMPQFTWWPEYYGSRPEKLIADAEELVAHASEVLPDSYCKTLGLLPGSTCNDVFQLLIDWGIRHFGGPALVDVCSQELTRVAVRIAANKPPANDLIN